MRFDEHHIVILDSLTKQEAGGLLDFLAEERRRHVKCIEDAQMKMLVRPLVAPIYESAIKRHQEDLESMTAKVSEIGRKFNV